jgi:3-oxoacyl-[acyl-carrier protein] reductase
MLGWLSCLELRHLQKPLALLTGVGRTVGIAAGIARQLAADGWDLALNSWADYDRRMPWSSVPNDVENLREELRGHGADVLRLPGDLESIETPAAIFKAILKTGRAPSALILSHCESVDSNILDTTVESFDRHYAVNVRASWLLIREFALHVPASGGRIIALTSDAVVENIPYGSTKAALDRIVLACTRELADRHILANVINPGPIDTGWMNEAIRTLCTERQPSGNLGAPADIANVISFLLSDRGSWINGQLIKADGGSSA